MIDSKTAGRIARAFWRRIEPFKNDYEKELPKPLPVTFQAHMETALCLLNLPHDTEKLMQFYSVETIGDLIQMQSQHIERLQAKLPQDNQKAHTPNPRGGGA